MKTIIALAGISLVLIGWASPMRADDLGFEIQAGSTMQSETLTPDAGGVWSFPTGTVTVGSTTITTGTITGTDQTGLIIDPDPSINFGFGASNTGSTTQTITFTFPMPSSALSVSLPPGTYNVSATFGDTLTANAGDTAMFSVPTGSTTFEQSFINGLDAGVDIVPGTNSSETVTGGADGDTEVFSFPKESTTETLTSTGTTMSVTVSFDLSPGDSASFSGSFIVSSVPEPSSIGLGLLAVAGFGVLVWRCGKVRA